MTSKLNAKNLLDYIRTTKDKYKFRAEAPDKCPIACYLKSLGYRDPEVFGSEIFYTDSRGYFISYSAFNDRNYPRWILDFVTAYDEAKPKHRLATAAKVLERVVAKQSKKKVSSQ